MHDRLELIMSFANSAEKLDTSKFGILSQAIWLVFRLFRYTIRGCTVHTDRICSCHNIYGSKMIRKIWEYNGKSTNRETHDLLFQCISIRFHRKWILLFWKILSNVLRGSIDIRTNYHNDIVLEPTTIVKDSLQQSYELLRFHFCRGIRRFSRIKDVLSRWKVH